MEKKLIKTVYSWLWFAHKIILWANLSGAAYAELAAGATL